MQEENNGMDRPEKMKYYFAFYLVTSVAKCASLHFYVLKNAGSSSQKLSLQWIKNRGCNQ